MRVHLVPVATATDLSAALAKPTRDAEHLIVDAHGVPEGYYLPELAESIAAQQEFNTVYPPTGVAAHAHLRDRVVISTACCSGSAEMSAAFTNGGASVFIAPTGYPGDEALLYLHCLVSKLSSPNSRCCAVNTGPT